MHSFAAEQAQASMTLGTFIFSVASGLMVTLLAYLTGSIRRIMKQHCWLVEQVNNHSKAIETQGKAIEDLLKEQRRDRLPPEAQPRRGRGG